MLALIPSTLLLLTALVIFILRRVRRGVGVAWVVGSLGTLLTFAVSLFLRWRLPQEAAFSAWLPFSVFTDSPIFGLDNTTWPYLFALAAVGLAVLLSASARLNANSPLAWMGVLTLLSMGMLAVLSANLLTLILTWTLIDLLELVILQANSGERSLGVQTVIAFAVRVSGTALVMVSALLARGAGVAPTFSGLPPTAGLLILLAAGLRLGVLPLHLAELRTVIQRRGLGTVLRMVAAASALAVLGRLPGDVVTPNVAPALLAFTSLAVLYAAAMWAASADEISGRPFWLIALSGMAVAGVVQGVPQSGLGWGVVLILAGSLLFLFSARRRPILFIPLLALLALTGLPFTPASSGWTGLLASPFKFWQIPLLIAHALLLFGYTRFVFAPGEDLTRMERWIQAMYPLGLFVSAASLWLLGVIGWPGVLGVGVWWGGAVSLVLALAGGFAAQAWQMRYAGGDALSRWYETAARTLGGGLASFFGLAWLYNLLWWLYARVQQVIHVLTEILEGEGGVLWALVFLALLISLLRSRLAR